MTKELIVQIIIGICSGGAGMIIGYLIALGEDILPTIKDNFEYLNSKFVNEENEKLKEEIERLKYTISILKKRN